MSNYVIPSPYIDRIIINNTKQKEKTINIDMLINLLSPKSLFSPEIELEEEIPKIESDKLKIELLFVRDRTVSQMLDTSMEFVKSIMKQIDSSHRVANIDQLYLNLAERKGLIENVDQVSFMSMIRAKCTKQTITNPVITSRGENNYLTHIEKEVDASSGHVSVYLLIDIDIDNEIKSLQEQQNDTFLVGETILDNGKIASFSYGYYTIDDDQIWNGEVKIVSDAQSDKFYTDETTERELARRKFYNTKIQDFRVYTKLPIRSNDLMIPEIKKANDLELMDNRYYLKSSDSPIQFGGKAAAGIVINISMLTLLRKHSAAYNLLQQTNGGDLRSLFSQDEIDIKVYRKRVREEGLGDNRRRLELEDFQENEKKIYLPDTDFRTTKYGLDIIKIYINDKDYVDNITTGDYCYGVEIRFSDPITRLLKKDLEDFEIARSRLEEYYKSSTILGYYGSTGNYVEGHYDPEINKFTNKFSSEWNTDGEIGNPFREIFTNYKNLMLKTSKKKEEEITSEIEQILPLISPITGTPDNILTFLNLYETNLGLLKRIYEITRNNTINLEEKYFNKYLHKISKRQRQDKLQQLPFSMKSVIINAAGNISAEESFDYDLLRNIIENGSRVNINDDFSRITPRRTATTIDTQPPRVPQVTSAIVDRAKIRMPSANQLQNIIAGILGSPERTSTKDISNGTIADVYKKQKKKKQRRGSK